MNMQCSKRLVAGAAALLGLLSMGMAANAEAGGHGHRGHAAERQHTSARFAVRHGHRQHAPHRRAYKKAYRQGYRKGARQQRRHARALHVPRAAYRAYYPRAQRYAYSPSRTAVSVWLDGISLSYYDD
jgi:hypothetical protein